MRSFAKFRKKRRHGSTEDSLLQGTGRIEHRASERLAITSSSLHVQCESKKLVRLNAQRLRGRLFVAAPASADAHIAANAIEIQLKPSRCRLRHEECQRN